MRKNRYLELLLYIKSMESKFLESMYMLKYNLFGVLSINFVIKWLKISLFGFVIKNYGV